MCIRDSVDTVFFLNLTLVCFSAAGISLSAFNRKYENFTSIMLGMSVVFPPIYAIVLVIKTILSDKWIIQAKKSIPCFKLCYSRDGEHFQVNEDVVDPLLQHLADSEISEASLLKRQNVPHYNSLVDM